MGKKYVLDTSAIISGKNLPLNIEAYMPQTVFKEVKSTENLPLLERIIIQVPSDKNVRKAIEAAKETGDIHKLSKTDIDVIALSLDIEDGVTITDDYAIQNVLRHLGKDFVAMNEKGITREFKWIYRCKGCGRYFSEYHNSCPYCGSELKLVKKKF